MQPAQRGEQPARARSLEHEDRRRAPPEAGRSPQHAAPVDRQPVGDPRRAAGGGHQHGHQGSGRQQAGDPPASPPPDQRARRQQAGQQQVRAAQLTQPQPGRPRCDPGDPPGQQERRHLDEGGGAAAQHPGREASGEPPHHQRPGRRHGQQVGGDRGGRDTPEHRDEDRRGASLGREGGGQRRGQPPRTREASGQRTAERQDARAGPHRELEAHRPDEERVDEHQGRDCQGQQPATRRRAPQPGGGRGQTRHHRRPQHRRLEAGDEREEGDQPDGERPAPAQAQPGPHRAGGGEHEGHVLAGHGQQVREPGRPEVVGQVDGLAAVVAEHDAQEETLEPIRQAGRASTQQAPDAVGEPADGVTRPPRPRGLHLQLGRHVAPGQAGPDGVGRGPEASAELDALARQAIVEPAGRAAPRPRLDAATSNPHDDPDRAGHGLGIGEQGHGAREGPGLGWRQPGPRPSGQARRE